MRLLLTSDWQAEHHNTDLCEQSLQELLAHASKYKPNAILNLGDLKDAYNPVDCRVIKWWVKATRTIVAAGHRFIILLGNHDRISQSRESKNWLDILRAAGAEVVTQPKWKQVGNGWVAFLPYTSDKKEAVKWARYLLHGPWTPVVEGSPKVLAFHLGIVGASMGAIKCTDGLTLDELQTKHYTACVGGHFHECQKVAHNVWYVGSPFCHEWGEAGQKKGHVLLKANDTVFTIEQLPTKIPGWYNIEDLESGVCHCGETMATHSPYENHSPVEMVRTPEPGSYIRSKITVSTKKVTDALRQEERRLRMAFPGCRYFVTHRLENPDELDVNLSGSTDREIIEQYVASTIPEAARFKMSQAVNYLASKLQAPDSPVCKSVKFLSLEATNTLTFDHIKINYFKQGLVLLRGVNRDWPRRSNGSGKTNCLSLLPVALSGQTLKQQKTDEWASERNDKKATVELLLKVDKPLLRIYRQRRPHGISFHKGDVDMSSGLTGKERKGGTQGLIEQEVGYDYHTLTNAVYIDQTVANGFVFGTQKDRMDLVGKLCELSRFEAAGKLVSQDIKQNQEAGSRIIEKVENAADDVSSLTEELQQLENQKETNWSVKLTKLQKELARLTKVHASISGTKGFYDELQDEMDSMRADVTSTHHKQAQMLVKLEYLGSRLKLSEKLVNEGKCDQCGQAAKVVGSQLQVKTMAAIRAMVPQEAQLRKTVTSLSSKIDSISAKITNWKEARDESEHQLATARQSLQSVEQAAKEEKARNAKLNSRRTTLAQKLVQAKRILKATNDQEKQLGIDCELYDYSRKAFSRGGIPLYLSASLCPVLNKAAEEYADIFYDGTIQIRFMVVGGEFTVEVVNPHGSGTSNGQSVGESAMAGVIAAFAIREVSPKTNLLVLDEPGHGLDPEGAKMFAQGLLKLKDRFDTIIVTTHSPIIDSILSGAAKIWTVKKLKGVSTLSTI